MAEDYDPLAVELENLQRLNTAIEKVLGALNTSTTNVDNVNSTVRNADQLLDLWIRVLASSDASRKLILDENWHGATSDLQAIEEEQSSAFLRAQEQQEAADRRQAELEARQKAEEERAASKSDPYTSMRASRGRGSSSATRGGTTTRPPVKKEVVSAYAQTRTKPTTTATGRSTLTAPTAASLAHTNESISSSGSATGQTTSRGRGRGVPIAVRGTRASRGRQAGVGRSQETFR